MDIQISLLYGLSLTRNKEYIFEKTSKITINDIDIKRTVEDAIIKTGLDVGIEPDTYKYLKIKDKTLVIYFKDDKPISKIKEIDIKSINMVHFFTDKQKDSIIENYTNKYKTSGYDISTLIYFAKCFNVDIKNVNQVISLIIISKFKNFEIDLQRKVYLSYLNILDNGVIESKYYDFSKDLEKEDTFVSKASLFLSRYKSFRSKFIEK